jgi:hypothetical protein
MHCVDKMASFWALEQTECEDTTSFRTGKTKNSNADITAIAAYQKQSIGDNVIIFQLRN